MGKKSQLLEKIEDATEKHGHAVVAMAEVAELVGEGKVEVNAETLDENGNIFARTTGVGNKPKPIVSEVYRAPAGFVPPAKKRQPKPEIYKFSALEVGDSFFVVGSQNGKSVAKTLTSTIANAIRRFSVETGKTITNRKGDAVQELRPTRQFIAVDAVPGQTYDGLEGLIETQYGARVFRVA